jgi:hypothetical protein
MIEGQLCQDRLKIACRRKISGYRYTHLIPHFSAITASFLQTTLDNTNADLETRAVWVHLAKKFGVPARCVYLTAPAKLCEHNDTVRALAGGSFNPEKRTILPHSAFFSFASRFQAPKEQEGFEEILSIPFQVRSLRSNLEFRSCRRPVNNPSHSFRAIQSSVVHGLSTGFDLLACSGLPRATYSWDIIVAGHVDILGHSANANPDTWRQFS